jgi:hypothetical protein
MPTNLSMRFEIIKSLLSPEKLDQERVRNSQNFVYGLAAVWPASLAIPSLVG